MPSKLIGVGRRLNWNDFKEADAPADAPHAAAGVYLHHKVSGAAPNKLFPNAERPMYYLADTITIQIVLTDATFRAPGVAKMKADEKAALLAHEQGHYDIYALILRDYFYELQTLTGRYYDSQADLVSRLSALKATYLDRTDEMQKLYDTDTEHSLDGAEQKAWLRAIRRATKLKRQPIARGKSGAPLERRLFDVLTEMKLLV
jgi:hypothetical protein